MVKKMIVIPKRYLKKDRVGRTRFIQQKSTGLMQGRKRVNKNQQDKTRSMRLTKNLDIDKDGDIDYGKGQIFGRSKKVKVRGSRKRKATIRRL